MLQDYWYYHGTSNKNANCIISQRKFNISKNIGTLGIGSYAFANSIESAKIFALRVHGNRRYLSEISIVQFKLLSTNSVVDLREPEWIEYRNFYIKNNREKICKYKQRYNNRGLNKKLDGIITDKFLEQVNLKQEVKAVLSVTTNKLYGNPIKNTVTGNSLELCVKDNSIIDFSNAKIVRGSELQ